MLIQAFNCIVCVLRETLKRYASAMEGVIFKLLLLMAKNLGVGRQKLTSISANYYRKRPEADKVLGISPHSDASIVTLLIQTNEVPGQQIRVRNWVPSKPVPDASIDNIRDVTEDLAQDLASKTLKEIPDRYIQREPKDEHISLESSDEIPVIDLQKLFSSDDDEMSTLHSACKDWGFFQLINHGAEELIKKMLSNVKEFFHLPLEEKKAYAQLPNDLQGYGQAFVVSEDQKLDWCDMLALRTLPISERNIQFWSTNPTSFREILEKKALEMERLTVKLLSLMSKNLGVEAEKLTSIFENGKQVVRMNYYPPCPEADKVVGITPHSDASIITLLVQTEVEGLQIKKNESWVPIKPISGAFVVNVGDVIEILSNGLYKSIEHRAVVQPEKERISIAGFQNPSSGIVIEPLADLFLKEKTGANYKATSYDNYLKSVLSAKLDGKSMLNLLKLEKHI